MKLNVADLIEQGLVKKKTYTEGEYKGLSVLKYTKKVFFKNLWHLDGRLLECRGTVVDEEDNIIVLPFKKVFNLHENGTEVDKDLDVIVPDKINGFMCAVTNTEKYGLIISTTGTLDSEFALLAKKHITNCSQDHFHIGITYLFEICDKSDPHIVEEDEGAYLIGVRNTVDGILSSESTIDVISLLLKCKRPKVMRCKFYELLLILPYISHEGYMVRDANTNEVLCKIKSPMYLSKKALMRVGKARIDVLFDQTEVFKQRIDEEFYGIVDYITKVFDKEDWCEYSEQQRRTFIEEYYNGK